MRRAFGRGLISGSNGYAALGKKLVDSLLDNIEAQGAFDLVEDFTAAIPKRSSARYCEFRRRARTAAGWSLAILGALEFRMTPERFEEGNLAVDEFIAFLDEFVSRRRNELTDDDDDLLARPFDGKAKTDIG